MTEQRARGRQLDLLMLAARDLAPQRVEPTRRSEIVTLLRILLSDHLIAAAEIPEVDND
ncbi:MAG TPA: hypothetical protein VHT52_21510 [Stellaceae bacterium]|jgi:hypothetical protein|nr:hypothetical protein [Stellaceae bacterium]